MNTTKKHPVILYLIFANGLTWLGWIPALVLSQSRGYLLPMIANVRALTQNGFADSTHLLVSILFQAAVYGPLVAALAATAMDSGRAGLKELGRQMLKVRIAGRWYLHGLWTAVAIVGMPFLIGAALGWIQWDFSGIVAFLPYLLPAFCIQLLTSGLGEEPGWRGFLWPHLQARFPGEKAVWILGIIWAIWHYPLTVFVTLPQLAGAPAFAVVLSLLTALAGQTMTLIGIAFLYVWLYNHTRSLWLVMLFHALTNTLNAIPWGTLNPILPLLVAAMPWGVVLLLEKTLPKGSFPGSWTQVTFESDSPVGE